MRIIAGRFRSRKLKTFPGLQVRPTPDRLRESLFSILLPRLKGKVFLDAYAGSGAIGLEALSRGASHAILIERSIQVADVIRENIELLGVKNETTLICGATLSVLPQLIAAWQPAISFIDPPYEQTSEYEESLKIFGETASAYVIAQHPSKLILAEQFGGLRKSRVLRQGDNSLTFYESVESQGE